MNEGRAKLLIGRNIKGRIKLEEDYFMKADLDYYSTCSIMEVRGR